MEQNIIISIGTYKAISLAALLVAGAWYASRRFTGVEIRVGAMEERMRTMEGRIDRAFSGSSPLALLEKGEALLRASGLKRYIDDHRERLIAEWRRKGAAADPYYIQESVFVFFDELDFERSVLRGMRAAAFDHGVNIDVVRRVGGIYFRDLCLAASGFDPKDLAS